MDRRRIRVRAWLLGALCLTLIGFATPADATAQPPLAPGASWLATFNWYRRGSGLPEVVEEPSWSAGIRAHINYLNLTPPAYRTGEYANAHRENPASPYYTAEGDAAGRSSNLTFGIADDVSAIESWMGAPFHALQMLNPGLTRTAYARDPSSSVAGLNVLSGITPGITITQPILFPGSGATVPLSSFGRESPDPRSGCPAGTGYGGLPIIAMLPASPPTGTSGRLETPQGTLLPGVDLCVQTAATFDAAADPVYGPAGAAVLARYNAVFLIPRTRLPNGSYRATITRPGQADLSWSFDVRVPPDRLGCEPVGGLITSRPAVARTPAGLEVVGVGTDRALWRRTRDANQWSAWSSLGGVVEGDPSIASNDAGEHYIAVRGADQALWIMSASSDGVWSGWRSAGGILSSSPAVVSTGRGRALVLARGADNALWVNQLTDGRWSGWWSQGGVLSSAPSAAAYPDGATVRVLVRGADGAAWERLVNGYGGSGWWSSLGGLVRGEPAVAISRWGRSIVAVRGLDDQIWLSSGGGRWIPLGVQTDASPSVAPTGDLLVAVLFRWWDGTVWLRTTAQ